MGWIARAALAAALLGCAVPKALADTDSHWLTDPKSSCAVFDANARAGDAVIWAGACEDGYASGLGTASFTSNGAIFESFTGAFAKGVAQDGHVVVHWGNGWTYDGNDVHGQFNGAGVLTNDKLDRFEGNWIDGKMNGHGTLLRASGERYEGDWKNDLPNGAGLLKRADGTTAQGIFADGKLVAANDAPDAKADAPGLVKADASAAAKPAEGVAPHGFENISGKTLTGIDGSHIALTLIEGGIERQITPAGGAPQKTTFTFMNDRLGTVVEDGGRVTDVTGFFRLTDTGVEVRYADGRSEILTASDDGGVLMSLVSAGGDTSCRSWYPDDHVFSEADKKAALAAYASRLGLQPAAANSGCSAAAPPAPVATLKPEHHAEAKPAHASFHPQGKVAALEQVAVRDSTVHTIDAPLPAAGVAPEIALPGPLVSSAQPGQHDASHCLKVDSDGHDWGFRNACGFAVQFAYCLMQGGATLTDCGKGGVTGSVAAGGFGALSADNSLSEKDADHDFRWVACDGGAGEVVPHLDHADPPSGRCERAAIADAH